MNVTKVKETDKELPIKELSTVHTANLYLALMGRASLDMTE